MEVCALSLWASPQSSVSLALNLGLFCVCLSYSEMLAFTLTAFLELMDHGIVSWDMVSITFIKQVRPPDSRHSLLPCLPVGSGIWGSADTRRLAGLWEDWSESPHRHIARWAPMWASSQARNNCSPRENWDRASQATSYSPGFHFSSDLHSDLPPTHRFALQQVGVSGQSSEVAEAFVVSPSYSSPAASLKS